MLTPELSLCGYPPEDLLLRPAFMRACADALLKCAGTLAELQNLVVVVGHPHQILGRTDVRSKSHAVQQRFNAASVLKGGQIVATYCKRELPNYQVFDERRYFASGRELEAAPEQGAVVFDVGGLKFGLNICEDAWFAEPARASKAAGAQVLCVLNASPFHLGKIEEREQRMRLRAKDVALPLLYVHMTGGQDEVVFDGGSFAMDADGNVKSRAVMFEESLSFIDVAVPSEGMSDAGLSSASLSIGAVVAVPSMESQAWSALVTGVRDYMGKNGFKNALIGLSGGIDSALVLAIAVDALGAERVRAVMMPSPYTADISMIDARDMAKRLNVRYDEIAIAPMFDAFKQSLAGEFDGLKEDTTEENIQARVRGTVLMALSNKFGSIVLTTGNKSEMATGYCTLYGDMAGGFAVIKDVAKTLVYRLATWKNAQGNGGLGEIIPLRIITRPPSAELRPDQTDQDSLPEYEILDAIVQRYMEDDQSMEDIIGAGFHRADVERVTWLIKTNEYKRRQAPIGIRITHRGFGRDWRYPITSKFRA